MPANLKKVNKADKFNATRKEAQNKPEVEEDGLHLKAREMEQSRFLAKIIKITIATTDPKDPKTIES